MPRKYCPEEEHEWSNIGADNDTKIRGVLYKEVIIDQCNKCPATFLQCYLEPMKDDDDFDPDETYIMDENCKRIIQ